MKIEIIQTTPTGISIALGSKNLTIEGEAFIPGHGSPNFVIFSNSVQNWNTQFKSEKIDIDERNEIIDEVVSQLRKKGWSVEIE